MNLCLKVTVGLFLLVQTVHRASLQNSTDSPGRPIDSSWWRKLSKFNNGGENTAFSAEEKEYEGEGTAMESGNDYSGIASGAMATFTEEEENVARTDKDANDSGFMDAATTALPLMAATQQPEAQNSPDAPVIVTSKDPVTMIADAPVTTIADAPVTMIADAPVTKIADAPVTTIPDTPVTATPDAPVKTATDQNNSSSVNATEAEEGFQNSTISPTHPKTDPSLPDSSSNTNFTTILAPAVPASKESTTTNTSESVNKTVVVKPNPTKLPEATHKPTMLLSTPPSNSWTTGFIPVTATVARTNAPEEGEDADKAAASGSSSDRGLASDATTRRHSAWGAILGTAVAVMCVGLVAYVILKNKHKRDFSHRKLVEEFPSNPVHRLDNNEPLDLNFGGSAYYNPGLQGDNIQMTNFP